MTALPRSTPSAQDTAAAGIEAFLVAVEAAPDLELHSLMVLRHGHVVAEGWWAPYGPDQVHLLYSLSKSFTSTALGFARADGLLTLDDPVLDHLPDLAAAATHPWTRAMRVRHLAAMATGHREDTLERAVRLDATEPVRGFLQIPPDAEPGTLFAYNNLATYTLAAILQRLTGQTLTDYLRPRLFTPLGIGTSAWDAYPPGRELGLSGLHLTTESLAAFGQLYLADGVWRDGAQHARRVLPEGWVAEATREHVSNADNDAGPDWRQGYGLQFWRARHGYRGDGAYGQFCLVLPEQDAVVVITGATEDMQGVLDLVWAHLLPALGAGGSAEDDVRLAARLGTLALPFPDPAADLDRDPERRADDWLRATGVTPGEDGWALTVERGSGRATLPCGERTWLPGSLPAEGGRATAVVGAGGWRDPGTFVAELALIQTPHRLRVELDTRTGHSVAAWHTVPLGFPFYASLSTDIPA